MIIDNFNTVTPKDSILEVVLKYYCKLLLTIRSRFDNYTSMNLEEIADTEALVKLMGCFYSDAEKNRPIMEPLLLLKKLNHGIDTMDMINNLQ